MKTLPHTGVLIYFSTRSIMYVNGIRNAVHVAYHIMMVGLFYATRTYEIVLSMRNRLKMSLIIIRFSLKIFKNGKARSLLQLFYSDE